MLHAGVEPALTAHKTVLLTDTTMERFIKMVGISRGLCMTLYSYDLFSGYWFYPFGLSFWLMVKCDISY